MFCPDERNYLITGQISRITALTPDFYWNTAGNKTQNWSSRSLQSHSLLRAIICTSWVCQVLSHALTAANPTTGALYSEFWALTTPTPNGLQLNSCFFNNYLSRACFAPGIVLGTSTGPRFYSPCHCDILHGQRLVTTIYIPQPMRGRKATSGPTEFGPTLLITVFLGLESCLSHNKHSISTC